MNLLKRLFARNSEAQSMSHTNILAAFMVAVALLQTCSTLLTLNRIDNLERLSIDCDYYVETTMWWKDSPTGETVLRDLPYRNFDYAYDQAALTFNTQLSAVETTDGLLDSFQVTLHSDCPYGHQVLHSNKFVCSESNY